MVRTVVSGDGGAGTAVRLAVALEAERMGADQFPPARACRTAAARSHRPPVAHAAAFPASHPFGRPDAAGRALAARLQSPRKWAGGLATCDWTRKLMSRALLFLL